MKLIIGLGNPGPEYENTWHNCGFLAVNNFRSESSYVFSPFKLNKKFNALVAEGKIGREKIILALPQTFMNESGRAARALASYYKIKPEDIWVAHDDLDLPLGKIRLRQSGSSAGHKGVKSIIDRLGTENFARFRIGIGAPNAQRPTPNAQQIPAEKFVLQKFGGKNTELINQSVHTAGRALTFALKEGLEKAMAEYN